nr:iron chelate uptake ABC transporter family permease subunit [Synergistales bacterium]
MKPRAGLILSVVVLSLLLAICLLWVISVGEVPIPRGDVLGVISGRIPSSDPRSVIVLSIRLPRALAAAAAGAVLSGSGVIFQGVLLNPLAEPYTLGVATGAALGASLAITL